MKRPRVCKKCGESLQRLIVLALACDAGARCYPHPLACQHEFVKADGKGEDNDE